MRQRSRDIRSSVLRRALILGAFVLVPACRVGYGVDEEDRLDPAAVAGVYRLHQVDGHDIPWYHQLAGVDCRAAFVVGQLELETDASFFLTLDYDYRCLGANPGDGSATLTVRGTIRHRDDGIYYLHGTGPNFVNPQLGVDRWTLSVTPNGEFVTLRFTETYGEFFADPILTMGPRTN
jgi:hypothetical protein